MRRGSKQGGYALIILLLVAALVLILLGAEVPRVLTQGQREREEELIFRGEQYRRALALHYRKYARLPLKLEELVEPTNNLRFLRQLYPDPMSADGEWRLIRVGPLGEVVGSHTRERIQLQAPGAGEKAEEKAKEEETEEAAREPAAGGENMPIIGVASRSRRRSIKVYQGQMTYDTWEFIYDPVADALRRGARPAAPAQPSSPKAPQPRQQP
ncbi:MAG: hypothetical protein ACE5H2_05350 [Terriglobia bacterium]